MNVVFLTTLKQMMVLFIIMLIGYIANKKKLVGENMDSILSKLLSNVIILALAFKTFATNCNLKVLADRASMLMWSIIVSIIVCGLAVILGRFFSKEKYQRNVYTYAFSAPNVTFLGVPIIQAVFGEKMLFDLMLCLLPVFIYSYSVGYIILNPKGEKFSFKNLINPIFIAMILGALFGIFDISLPEVAVMSLTSISDCMGPIAMLLTGFVLAKHNIKDLIMKKRVYLVALLRLVIIPLVFVFLLKLLSVDEKTVALNLCILAMPTGLNTVVFPAANNEDTSLGASMTLISSLFAVITVPIMFELFVK